MSLLVGGVAAGAGEHPPRQPAARAAVLVRVVGGSPDRASAVGQKALRATLASG